MQYIDIQNVYDFVWQAGDVSDFFKKIAAIPVFDDVTMTYTDVENIRVVANIISVSTNADDLEKYVDVHHDYKRTKVWLSKVSYSIPRVLDTPLCHVIVGISEAGEFLGEHGTGAVPYRIIYDDIVPPGELPPGNPFEQSVVSDLLPIFLTFALMHVKNIELIDKPISRQVRRRKERKGEPFYKVLSLEPFKKQVRNEARANGETEMQRALHICRGHFVTYSEEKPLFGKYSGTYWKPAHMRGNAKHGEVVKDYKIDV